MNFLKRLWRFFKRLWRKEPRAPLNLFAPDVLAEIIIHVHRNGNRHMFCSKFPPETTPDEFGQVTLAVIESAKDFGRQYGIEIKMEGKR